MYGIYSYTRASIRVLPKQPGLVPGYSCLVRVRYVHAVYPGNTRVHTRVLPKTIRSGARVPPSLYTGTVYIRNIYPGTNPSNTNKKSRSGTRVSLRYTHWYPTRKHACNHGTKGSATTAAAPAAAAVAVFSSDMVVMRSVIDQS